MAARHRHAPSARCGPDGTTPNNDSETIERAETVTVTPSASPLPERIKANGQAATRGAHRPSAAMPNAAPGRVVAMTMASRPSN
ncbi:hypothetical protein EYF80_008881 [Liparis tanakae]|uniref:Uncharacterized protein n=1 Tax=Liparis tanakae TaxID=230148 RepID=A0A4Z2ISP2_9TELE|nr:hypothetical protein EYF80_008881 [Liparis tanakae]